MKTNSIAKCEIEITYGKDDLAFEEEKRIKDFLCMKLNITINTFVGNKCIFTGNLMEALPDNISDKIMKYMEICILPEQSGRHIYSKEFDGVIDLVSEKEVSKMLSNLFKNMYKIFGYLGFSDSEINKYIDDCEIIGKEKLLRVGINME